MRNFSKTVLDVLLSCILTLSSGVAAVHAETDHALKLDARTLRDITPPPESPHQKRHRLKTPVKPIVMRDNETTLTVKGDDTIEKLLMRDCGLKSEETAPLIEEVRKRNKILNIRRLFIGQKLVVSSMRCTPPAVKASREVSTGEAETTGPVDHAVESLVIGGKKLSDAPPKQDSQVAGNIATLTRMWENIVTARPATSRPLSFKSGNYSLSLDPARYPVLFAMDGSRILIDQKKSIPPHYMPFIAEQEPTLRVVAESTSNGKRFLASLLRAGRFYSVEEDFNLEFGGDPKLTVRSDFKVERNAHSLLNNDVLLLNDEKFPSSSALAAFLKKEGFVLYEPFSKQPQPSTVPRNRLVQILAKTQPEIVDAVLSALSLPLMRDQYLEIAPPDDTGINLSIKIERPVAYNGTRLVILCSGDPAVSTISTLLEARGEHVVALEAQDDFYTIVERILAGLGIRGTDGFYQLWPQDSASYSLHLSGILIEGREPEKGLLLITDREFDRFIKDIAEENGYSVYQKK